MQCVQPLWKRSKCSYFCLTLIRVEHLAKQTFEVVCQNTAAVFVLIIISLLDVCVCSYNWNYAEGLWKQALQAGYGQVWDPAWDVRLSNIVITQIVIHVSWGVVSHLPGRAVGMNLGLLAFWMCCHPHVQDVVFHLQADRWVESRPCWAAQRWRSFLQSYWDLVPWRMLCHSYVPRCTANLNFEKRRRKNTSPWRWDSVALTSLLSIDRERPQKGRSAPVRSGLVPEGLCWVHEVQWGECTFVYPARAKATQPA